MCWSYNRQYGTRFLAVMPTNLYGTGDNFDLQNSHVIPALIRKMHEAKAAGAGHVTIWGTGKPMREFLYADDMAEACVFLSKLPDVALRSFVADSEVAPLINIGCGVDQSIEKLAHLTAVAVGFEGRLLFDGSKPDGTPRKLLDVGRIGSLGWTYHTSLVEGLRLSYAEFLRSPLAIGVPSP